MRIQITFGVAVGGHLLRLTSFLVEAVPFLRS
jgi:hypothetical protein